MRKPFQIVDIVPKIGSFDNRFFGFCTHCGGRAAKEAHFKQDGIVVIEKYCEDCLKPENWEKVQTVYSRFD